MKKFITEVSELLYLSKISLKMKLTYILLFFALFQLQANTTFSQNVKVTLDCKQMNIEDVLSEIERKTNFKFLYEKDVFQKNKIVSISSNKEKLSSILKRLFKEDNIDYKVLDKQIVLHLKGKKPLLLNLVKKRISKLLFQQYITGKVTNEKGESLPGATVVFKGTTKGVSTDYDGDFRIEVVEGATTLIISYIGYETQEVVIDNKTVVNAQLKESITGLDETIIVAYGKVKREALTGSVGVVAIESVAGQGRILNIDQALQGQVAGVQVSSPSGAPGTGARVRIRGSSSILGTNQPLYVIDGVPIAPTAETPGYTDFIDSVSNGEATAHQNGGYTNDLGFIDFNNIESITVLKDATATAIYGSRASAGVVVITTKNGGNGTGKPQFELAVTQRMNLVEKIDVLNTSQYEELYTEAIQNYVNSGGTVPSTDSFGQGILNGTEVNSDIDTDWQDLIGNTTSYTTNYALSVRGAREKGSYYSALSLQNDQGALKGDKLTRYTFALNLKQNLKDNLSFFANLSLGRIESDLALGSLYSVVEAATFTRPDVTPYDEDGNLVARFGDIYNPLTLQDRRATTKNLSLLTSAGLEYEPIKNLFVKSMGILQYVDSESYSFYPSYTQSGLSTNGKGNLVDRSTINPTIETTITYDFSIGKSNANVLIGNTYQSERTETNSFYGENFPNDDTLTGINYAGENVSAQQAIIESRLVSFFSRFTYDYDNRYLLSFAGRIDGSSKFGENNRWASFPSFGIGWNIHREKFTENASWLNFLKLRASIGQSGNTTFDPNQSFSLFGALNGTNGVYNGDTGVVPLRIGNPDLKWEITTQKDLGVEFAVLDNKIKGEIGYFEKETKDVLYQTTLASSSGLYTVIGNLGSTENNGFELTLNFNILDKENFKWNFGFNAATAKSKLTSINTTYQDEYGGVSLNGLYFREGQSLGLIRGHVANGLFQSQEQIDELNATAPSGLYQASLTSPGDVYFADLDGDGEVSTSPSGPDATTIGSIEPDFFGGINTKISYKGLSLNVFANYSLGNDIYWKAGENSFNYTFVNDQGNKQAVALDRWTPDNTDATYPRAVYRTNLSGGNQNNRISSLYVLSGDYLRIKTITLRYNLAPKVLQNINIQALSFYVTGTNLFTITNYPGADPEYSNIFSFRTPVDNNKYPVSKQIIAGVSLTF